MVRVATWLVLLVLTSCTQSDIDASRELPMPDFEAFRCGVEPILVRTCGFTACHASPQRRYRIFAPQRLRLEGSDLGRLSLEETTANYHATRGFIQNSSEESLLLQKPLDSAVGGYYHEGKEHFGGVDVFLSKSDVDYARIAAWIDGTLDAVSCEELEGS